MEIKIKDSTEFEHLLEALATELVDANIHMKLRSDLTDAVAQYQTEYSQSDTFWSLTFQAHLDAAVFRLCKIYDQNNKALSLRNLLDTIKANISIFDKEEFRERLKDNPFVESLSENSRKPDERELDEDIKFVSEHNPLVKNLMMWRNNFFAHRGAKHVINKNSLETDYPLTIADVEKLLSEGIKILNRYSSLFRASTYSTNIIGRDDYQFILKCIQEYVKSYEQRIEDEIKQFEKSPSS